MPFQPQLFSPRSRARPVPVAWCILRFLVWSWGLGAGMVLAAETGGSKEHQIKAAFLFNFTKFVEWPEQRFGDDKSPIIIGVLGKTPVRDELEKIVQGRKVNGREILVKALEAPVPDSVQVLFVGAGEEGQIAGALKSYQGAGVLTVGESTQFAAAGGIITFTREADKVRFEINVAAAEQSRLKISAQLQKLATKVRRQP